MKLKIDAPIYTRYLQNGKWRVRIIEIDNSKDVVKEVLIGFYPTWKLALSSGTYMCQTLLDDIKYNSRTWMSSRGDKEITWSIL